MVTCEDSDQGQDITFQKQLLVTWGNPGPEFLSQSSERDSVMLSSTPKSSGKIGVADQGYNIR